MNSLGINKAPKDTRVVVAMSGGVDSSVVAAMLHDEGYDVVGITLQLYDYGAFAGKKGACCAGQDIYDAKRVADDCGFPHYVLNYETMFKQAVIEDFADSYVRGETPIPCVRCNQRVKFEDLLKTARELNADVMATGHYVKRVDTNGKGQLLRGRDMTKDQSYFLFTTTQEQLDFLRFPLGDMTKAETRKLADKYGLVTADKPDSQDICFVPDGDYAKIVGKLRPDALNPGKIIHANDGRVLGDHEGVIHYTIGQRKGLGLGGGETQGVPLFVVALRPANNEVVVGPREALARDRVVLKEMNWLGDKDLNETAQNILVKVRSSQEPLPATIYRNENGQIEVALDQAYYGISPGQACVVYDGERCLGGGWIDHAFHTAFQDFSRAA